MAESRLRTAAAWLATLLACLLIWFALLAPDELGDLSLSAFVRLPVEALLFVALVLVLPRWAGRTLAVSLGVALALLTVLKVLDMGFFMALDRPVNPVFDWGYAGSAVGLLSDSVGHTWAVVTVVVGVVLVLALVVLLPWALLRLARLVGRHRVGSGRTVLVLGVVWVVCAAFGARLVPGAPIASTSATTLAASEARQVSAELQDRSTFARAAAVDPFRRTPGQDLLTGLRGKDVVVAFVESYGQVAVQGSSFSPQVDRVLDAGTTRLAAAGYSARSAFLTSPTFGGISWLAHSTLQSGLWIDNQQRYDDLVASDRFTLSDAFRRAGWRTVGDVPSNRRDWPQGRTFYHYDKVYDSRNVGYAGPKFSYETMPDQYILSAFQRRELTPHHPPVMAEIDLVSSHTPWTPLPRPVPWSAVGDGSVYDGMPAQGQPPAVVWRHADQVRAAYGQSVQYSLNTLFSFLQRFHDKNLVLVVLGDHQPATIVSGAGATHNVPISIIAHDPAVLRRISGWSWQDGMRPGADAPVWPMDTFRNRFLTAYGPGSR